MAWRSRRSIKIAPGIRINLNKKSTSVRIGVRGLGHTISFTGKRTTSVGIPGAGFSYSETISAKQRRSNPHVQKSPAITDGGPSSSTPRLSFFQFLLMATLILFGITFCASQYNSPKDKLVDKEATATQSDVTSPHSLGLVQASIVSTPDAVSVRNDSSPVNAKVMFAKARVNIRSMPTTTSKVIKIIDIGTSVEVLEKRDGWVNVTHSTHVGWIAERLLLEQRPASTQRNIQPRASNTKPPAIKPRSPIRSNYGYQRGPRGGCYYYTASGNKRYVDRSLCN